jgi:two-component system cell cycle response regulator
MRRILIIDDDRESTESLVKFVTEEGLSVQTASDSESALHRVRAWKPHLVLLSGDLRSDEPLTMISRLKLASHEDYGPIIYYSDALSMERLLKIFEAGADDFLPKPFVREQMIGRFRAMLRYKESQDSLRRATHRIEEMSALDELTGLLNFRALCRQASDEISRSEQFRKPVSALHINLDGFSDLNRKAGFETGNFVLKEVGTRIRKTLRSIDLASRIGADEFFALLIETDLASAEVMAQRILKSLQNPDLSADSKEKVPYKISACIGVAGFSPGQPDQRTADLLHITLEALRSAKATGPGSIEIYSFS